MFSRKRFLSFRFYREKYKKYGLIKGIGVLCARLLSFAIPYFNKIVRPIILLLNKISSLYKIKNGCLYAFYDLQKTPATFDIIDFLVLADLERQNRKLESIHVIIVPGQEEGFRANSLKDYGLTAKKELDSGYMYWRLYNILLPACYLLPACSGTTLCSNRPEARLLFRNYADTFPVSYSPLHPVADYSSKTVRELMGRQLKVSLSAPEQAKKYIADWIETHCKDKKLLVISLRSCVYQEKRNSNLQSWKEFASKVNSDIYFPVLIPDCETAFDELSAKELKDMNIFPEISWNLFLRCALYEASFLSFSISGGTAEILYFLKDVRYLIFKTLVPDYSVTSEDYLRSLGMQIGSQQPFAARFQRIIWKTDDLDSITDEFNKIISIIEEEQKS